MATAALARRTPLLARLGVGAKLMLLVLLPVAVLLGVTIAGSVNAWRNASALSDFRRATEQSFVVSDLVTALADERTHTDAEGEQIEERLEEARDDHYPDVARAHEVALDEAERPPRTEQPTRRQPQAVVEPAHRCRIRPQARAARTLQTAATETR